MNARDMIEILEFAYVRTDLNKPESELTTEEKDWKGAYEYISSLISENFKDFDHKATLESLDKMASLESLKDVMEFVAEKYGKDFQ